MDRIRVCVVGATGFAGIEVCRLVLGHPNMELAMVTDRKEAGTRLDAVYPSSAGACDLELSLPEPDAIAQAADVAFLAVPHTASLALTPELLRRGVTVLDLSADYRLHDPQVYEQWYNTPHTSPELLSQTVYGLPELTREGILALAERRAAGQAVLVSVPGCYPTATALAATPALSAGLAGGDLVIADAISGVSGAGRGANARTHYCHANESVEAYGVAKHRHTPEIEQTLSEVAGRQMNVVFTPHLAPLTRGLRAAGHGPARRLHALHELRLWHRPRPGGCGPGRPTPTHHHCLLCHRQPGQGRCRPGRPERKHRARPARACRHRYAGPPGLAGEKPPRRPGGTATARAGFSA